MIGDPTFGECQLESKKSQAEPSSEDNPLQKLQLLLAALNEKLACLRQNSAIWPPTVQVLPVAGIV